MAESNSDLTDEYNNALNELSEIIRENFTYIENNPPGNEYRMVIRDAIVDFSKKINTSVSVDIRPVNYQTYQPIQRLIYILPQSPQSAQEEGEEEEEEDYQPELHSFLIRSVPETGEPIRFTLLQLFEFMHFLPRLTPNDSRSLLQEGGSGQILETCSICLQRYFEPRNQPPRPDETTSETHLPMDMEPSQLPVMDRPEAPTQLPCGHIFGEICVERWICEEDSGGQPTCPLCRRVWTVNLEGDIHQVIVNL